MSLKCLKVQFSIHSFDLIKGSHQELEKDHSIIEVLQSQVQSNPKKKQGLNENKTYSVHKNFIRI